METFWPEGILISSLEPLPRFIIQKKKKVVCRFYGAAETGTGELVGCWKVSFSSFAIRAVRCAPGPRVVHEKRKFVCGN